MPNTLALLAHPNQVNSLVEWLSKHHKVLSHFKIRTTPDLAEHIQTGWELGTIEHLD